MLILLRTCWSALMRILSEFLVKFSHLSFQFFSPVKSFITTFSNTLYLLTTCAFHNLNSTVSATSLVYWSSSITFRLTIDRAAVEKFLEGLSNLSKFDSCLLRGWISKRRLRIGFFNVFRFVFLCNIDSFRLPAKTSWYHAFNSVSNRSCPSGKLMGNRHYLSLWTLFLKFLALSNLQTFLFLNCFLRESLNASQNVVIVVLSR